jgi:MoaA/NifB/PqqE/SkfB family radical SAM enzyme
LKLTGVHLLLTYRCTYECDHCFVWSAPDRTGTMTFERVEAILDQSRDLGTVKWIYFEGGEPFLYYPVLVASVMRAADLGFNVGLVTNAYWATDPADARAWLEPFRGAVADLSVSSDTYHGEDARLVRNARAAARSLGIPAATICIAQPESRDAPYAVGQLPEGETSVRFRGRAARNLVDRALKFPYWTFRECPYEDLVEPGRVHADPFGYVHICQGISIGNLFERPLAEICRDYDPATHPITGPLLEGGPFELARRYRVPIEGTYADACHFCYETRMALRSRFPGTLTPDTMYGDA